MPAAYQDQNGKWWKECSSTKQLFGPVDSLEDLSEWFSKHSESKDGFRCYNNILNNKKNKQYYQENKDKEKERAKRYRQENQDKEKERNKLYYSENKDKVKETNKQYRKTPAGLLTHYKKSAKRREINFTLTLEWFKEQITKPEFNVCYFSGVGFIDGINHPSSRSLDRVSSTKGYSPDNVRWVCHKFNSWKSDLTLNEVAIMFKAMAEHHNVDPFEVLKKVA